MTQDSKHDWHGVFPATLCPFHSDESIDRDGLFAYIRALADCRRYPWGYLQRAHR